MIPCLIVQPHSMKSENQRPRSNKAGRSSGDEVHGRENGCDDEDRFIVRMVLTMLLVLVVPAILTLLSITLNPDSFQFDITPKQDY